MPQLSILGLDLTRYVSEGWIGVLLFFVLSGYLLAPPFLRWRLENAPRPGTPQYLLRRARRVFPAYYAQLIILSITAVLFTGTFPLDSVEQVLRHLTMQFTPLQTPVSPLNGVWWTLPVELTFYLTLPLLAYCILRHRVSNVLIVGLTITLTYHFVGSLVYNDHTSLSVFSRQFPGYFALFTIGVWAARFRLHSMTATMGNQPAWPWRSTWPWLALMILLIEALPLENSGREFWENQYYYYLWKPTMGFAIAGIIISTEMSTGILSKALSSRPISFLGKISYSFYLWHLPIFILVANYGDDHSWVLQWAIGLLLTLLVSTASERIFERPFLRSGRPVKVQTPRPFSILKPITRQGSSTAH